MLTNSIAFLDLKMFFLFMHIQFRRETEQNLTTKFVRKQIGKIFDTRATAKKKHIIPYSFVFYFQEMPRSKEC